MKLVALAVLLFAAWAQAKVTYEGYRLVSVGPIKTAKDVELIEGLRDESGEDQRMIIIIQDVIVKDKDIAIAVAPEAYQDFYITLEAANIPFQLVQEDMQKVFNENRMENFATMFKSMKAQRSGESTFAAPDYYMTISQMQTWLQQAASSSSIARYVKFGSSYQGYDLLYLAINEGRSDLPAVWLDAGIHAREWIAPATCLYIIDKILFGTDADSTYMRNNFRFYIAPEINPDGYEYSYTNDRFWRKTRQPYGFCAGADPNRNFDAWFGAYGTSNDPCSDTYRGPNAFSEPETRAVRDAINSISNMKLYMSLHSFSQLWLVPWAGNLNKPSDYSDLKSVGDRAAQAVYNVNGRAFEVGTAPDILYAASGGSFDWVKLQKGVKYAYTPELRPATTWEGGFDIPASNIYPSGAEIFAGFVSTCRDI